MYRACRHCIRFHGKYLDGSPSLAAEVAKLTKQVKSSDRRRQEPKKATDVGPPVKSPRKEKRKAQAQSAPPIPPELITGDHDNTGTDDRPVHYPPASDTDPDPAPRRSRKPERKK